MNNFKPKQDLDQSDSISPTRKSNLDSCYRSISKPYFNVLRMARANRVDELLQIMQQQNGYS